MKSNAVAKVFSLAFVALATQSWAGLSSSLMQDAPVLKPGNYEIKFQGDIIFNNGGGFQISPHFRFGLQEHLWDVDAYFGVGKTDFVVGGLSKFNLLPDIEGQVALSFLAGFAYMRDRAVSNVLIPIGVLISKEFQTDFGAVSPYGSILPEIYISSAMTTVPTSLVLGSKWILDSIKNWNFYSELSFSFYKSNFYLALGAGYPF
jgi:hypothetical protein